MEMPQQVPDSFELVIDSSPKIPTNQELYDFLNQFLKGWTGLSAQKIVGAGDDVPNLPLEKGLMFSKPFNGLLVIRTVSEFEGQLQKAADDDKSQAGQRDVFVEFFILFWHKFVSKFWGLDSRKLPPAVFRKSIPLDWPQRKMDVFLQVFVANYPLGIRFWANLTDEEINRWRNPQREKRIFR